MENLRPHVRATSYEWLVILIYGGLLLPTQEAFESLFGSSMGFMISRVGRIWQCVSIVAVAWLMLRDVTGLPLRADPNRRKAIRDHRAMRANQIMALQCLSLLVVILLVAVASENISRLTVGQAILLGSNLAAFFGVVVFRHILPTLLAGIYHYYGVLVVLNSVVIFITYPVGLYASTVDVANSNYYLLGLDNVGFVYSLVVLVVGAVYRLWVHQSLGLSYLLVAGFLTLSYFYVSAGTAMPVLILFILSLAAAHFGWLKRISYSWMLGIGAVSFFVPVYSGTNHVITDIVSYLGKDWTFSGRLYIWRAALSCREMEPWGWGASHAMFDQCIGPIAARSWVGSLGHVHNIFLEYWLRAGIIGALFFAVIFIVPWFSFRYIKGSSAGAVLAIGMVCIWISLMFEGRLETYSFWIVPALLTVLPFAAVLPDPEGADSSPDVGKVEKTNSVARFNRVHA